MRPLNLPQSISRPHPPILVAGGCEKKTLPLAARYADACNLRPGPEIPAKLEVLRRHCEAEGRDYDEIEKICMFAFDVGEDGSKVEELVEGLRWLSGMGILDGVRRRPGRGQDLTPGDHRSRGRPGGRRPLMKAKIGPSVRA